MAKARRYKETLAITPYFHCTSRCVRGSYLFGFNRQTGEDLGHRRIWLRERLLKLADVFSISLMAFAIMENHFHVVLRVDSSRAEKWTDEEVIRRWHRLFKGTDSSHRFIDSRESLTEYEEQELKQHIESWRDALQNIGWFMRCAKEPLARKANAEDGCTGRFWEGRYHCQALLDTKAVLACMTYVDLNPMRAKMCTNPEDDRFTSLHYRSKTKASGHGTIGLGKSIVNLDDSHDNFPLPQMHIPVTNREYLTLVDATARRHRSEKRGVLSEQASPILERIGIPYRYWSELEMRFSRHFHALVGSRNSLLNACRLLGQSCARGQTACHDFFGDLIPANQISLS